MRILSIRKGFQADHSSTSYEFFAIDKPLSSEERAKVARLSSRATPTKRKVRFTYNGEWSDLPGGWEPLMRKYYDVMYSESYDQWTLAMAFTMDKKAITEIKRYEFSNEEDTGITVESQGDRVIVSITCRLSADMIFEDGYPFDDDEYDDDEDEEDDTGTAESHDKLLDLLAQNREYLKKGDYRLLYAIRQEYGDVDEEEYDEEDDEEEDDDEEDEEGFEEEEMPPEPPGMNKLPKPVKRLLSLFERA